MPRVTNEIQDCEVCGKATLHYRLIHNDESVEKVCSVCSHNYYVKKDEGLPADSEK